MHVAEKHAVRTEGEALTNRSNDVYRCLADTGGAHLIVPIAINYEGIPEQATLANEAQQGSRSGLSNQGLFSWLKVGEVASVT